MALDVTPTEIAGLFQLLDTGSGLVAIDEIVDGIMRLRGNTKAILVDPAAADASLLARLLGLAAAAAASAPSAAAASSPAQAEAGSTAAEGATMRARQEDITRERADQDGAAEVAETRPAEGNDASVQMPPSDHVSELAS